MGRELLRRRLGEPAVRGDGMHHRLALTALGYLIRQPFRTYRLAWG